MLTRKTTKKTTKKQAPKKAPHLPRKKAPQAAPNTTIESAVGRDSRLPPSGTLLRKTDRLGNTRCTCTVEPMGFRYQDTLYSSLSAAALAASKDLGLRNTTQNGFTFWGLTKQTRDPATALEQAWSRYHTLVTTLMARPDDAAAKAVARVREHAQTLEHLLH